MSKRVFLTGVTGFLGGYMAWELLQRTGDAIYCLARGGGRGGDSRGARQRVADSLVEAARGQGCDTASARDEVEAQLGRRIHVFDGDICEPALGIDPADLGDLAFDDVWHLAARVDFVQARGELTHRANVLGSQEVLRFADERASGCFNYVSTAFVAGERSGAIVEKSADESFPSNNPYEESKRRVEKIVVQRHAATGRPYRILRPTVLVGPSRTKEPGSSAGLYGWLSYVYNLKVQLDKARPDYLSSNPVRVLSDSSPRVNFICVDQAVDAMFAIGTDPESHNEIFHIGSRTSTPLVHLGDAIRDLLGMDLRFIDDARDLQPADFVLRRMASRYNCYLINCKDFDLRNAAKYSRIQEAMVDADLLHALCERHFTELACAGAA